MKKISMLFLNFLILTTICQGQQQNASLKLKIQSSIIWSTSEPDGKQAYVAFRKIFNINEISSPAFLNLFAERTRKRIPNPSRKSASLYKTNNPTSAFKNSDLSAVRKYLAGTIYVSGCIIFGIESIGKTKPESRIDGKIVIKRVPITAVDCSFAMLDINNPSPMAQNTNKTTKSRKVSKSPLKGT